MASCCDGPDRGEASRCRLKPRSSSYADQWVHGPIPRLPRPGCARALAAGPWWTAEVADRCSLLEHGGLRADCGWHSKDHPVYIGDVRVARHVGRHRERWIGEAADTMLAHAMRNLPHLCDQLTAGSLCTGAARQELRAHGLSGLKRRGLRVNRGGERDPAERVMRTANGHARVGEVGHPMRAHARDRWTPPARRCCRSDRQTGTLGREPGLNRGDIPRYGFPAASLAAWAGCASLSACRLQLCQRRQRPSFSRA
jgi:hypothetical protein